MRPQGPPQGGPAAAALSALETLKQRACESVELNAARLDALSRDIWSRPELAYEEQQAHDTMTRFFSSGELPGAAWAVQPRYKLGTAFRAEWGTAAPQGPRPLRIAFLCEYDALPGIGHACGHNLIAEVGAAAALGLKAALESLPQPAPVAVQITVLGTPAEEQGGGKIDLINAGAFDGLDVVFMAHPSQENAAYLPDVAEHDVTVKYYGKASHAAAYPWEGVNALDAAVLAYNNLSVLRQQMKPTWRVHGVIRNGGVKPNIIPSYTELEFYLRAPSMKDLSVLTEKVENCFKSAALATGCKVEIKGSENDYYNVLPNKSLQKVYKENGKKLGIEFISEDCILNGLSGNSVPLILVHEFNRLVFQRVPFKYDRGEDGFYASRRKPDLYISSQHTVPDVCMETIGTPDVLNMLLGSTDFGNVTFVVPGLHPYFYIGSDALNHTEQYTEAAGSQNAQFYALRTAKALAMTALDVIFKPSLLEEVREDFRQVKLKEEGQTNPVEPNKESDIGIGACASH